MKTETILIYVILVGMIFFFFVFQEGSSEEESKPEISDNEINTEPLERIMYETNHTKRREKLEEFIGNDPKGSLTDDALFQLAEEYCEFRARSYEKVIQICDRIITDFPEATLEFTKPLEELMWCGHDDPWLEERLKYLKKYPDLSSDHALMMKSKVLIKLGAGDEAKKCFETLVKKHSNGFYEKEDKASGVHGRPHRIALKRLIIFYLKKEKMEEAWELYLDYYTKWFYSGDIKFLRYVAKQFAEKGQTEKAIHLVNKAIDDIKESIREFPVEEPKGRTYKLLLIGPYKEGETAWEHYRRENIERLEKLLAEAKSELEKYSREEKK